MSLSEIKVYHFHNGNGGGVLSVIKNLLQYSSNPSIENHVIHTINQDLVKEFTSKNIKGAATERVFYYSASWNFNYTCMQLSKLIPDENAVIVSHDWLELGMVSNMGLQNRVITFLHGDYEYYYHLAQLHQSAIDSYITIANSIAVKLKALLPAREKDIQYLRFPVPSVKFFKREEKSNNIIFIGRLTEEKGYHLLPVIDNILKQRNVFLNWHIVGETNESNGCTAHWDNNSLVRLYGNLNNEEVLSLLQNMDYYILPSLKEGMPVALIEAMKSGVIPFVNNISGGIQELVIDDETGFKIADNKVEEYVEKINELLHDKSKTLQMQNNCLALANRLFEPIENTKIIEDVILQALSRVNKIKPAKNIYGSRLDAKWIPNWTTKVIRHFLHKKNKRPC